AGFAGRTLRGFGMTLTRDCASASGIVGGARVLLPLGITPPFTTLTRPRDLRRRMARAFDHPHGARRDPPRLLSRPRDVPLGDALRREDVQANARRADADEGARAEPRPLQRLLGGGPRVVARRAGPDRVARSRLLP